MITEDNVENVINDAIFSYVSSVCNLSKKKRGGRQFCLLSRFFVINPFRKKIFILNQLDFDSKVVINNS